MTAWGDEPKDPRLPNEPELWAPRPMLRPTPDRARLRKTRHVDDDGDEPTGHDPVGVAAVIVGLVGIVVFGAFFALVAGVLGAVAGQRARESGRSFELAYLAFGLAALDGIVWIALHLMFELPFVLG